jgi:hypothetical protein
MKNKTMKIADKLTKVENSFTVNRYDNGFLFTVSGKNKNDDWQNAHIICDNMNSLTSLIREFSEFPLND